MCCQNVSKSAPPKLLRAWLGARCLPAESLGRKVVAPRALLPEEPPPSCSATSSTNSDIIAPGVARGPSASANTTVVVRQQESHPSHKTTYHKSLEMWVCWRCGSFARKQMHSLAKPCPGRAEKQGQCNLARIHKGLMPGSSKEALAFNKGKMR